MTWIILFLIGSSEAPASEVIWMAETFTSDAPKLRFEAEGDSWIFSGEIDRYEDKLVIDEMLNRSNGKFRDKTHFSKDLLNESLQSLQEATKTWKPPPHFEIKSKQIYSSGISDAQFQKLKEIFPYLKTAKSTSRRSAREAANTTTVFLELAFVELKKEAVEKLGLRFGSPIEFGTSVYLQKIKHPREMLEVSGGNPIGSFLDLALREGLGKVHFKQSVVAQNEKKASFHIGGEYAVRLQSENYSQLGKIDYGVKLEFVPRLLTGNKIHLEIKADIREPDMSSGIDGLPLIQSKNLNTQLVTNLSETMAIGGFVRSHRLRARQSLPGLADIPVFGHLFSSKDFLQHKSEAYLFITPREIKSQWIPKIGDWK